MKLEVEMYVRTHNGIITTIYRTGTYKEYDNMPCTELRPININVNGMGIPLLLTSIILINQEDKYIKRASFDIIDLIEEGDYVNGYLVVGIEKDNLGELYVQVGHIANNEYKDVWVDNTIYLKDIKEVLTKEQYNANTYKL